MRRERRLLLPVLILFVGLLAPRFAAAQHVYAPGKPEMETRWYGWQTVLLDISTLAVSLAAESPHAAGISYLAAGPLVHVLHGQYENAGISAALRVLAPAVGAAPGLILMTSCDGWGCLPGGLAALVGAGAGGLVAVVVDAAVLSKERVPAPPESPPDEARAMRVRPTVGLTNSGATAGLVGTF